MADDLDSPAFASLRRLLARGPDAAADPTLVGVDWPTLLRHADRHAVLPMLAWSLTVRRHGHIPLAIIDRARLIRQHNALAAAAVDRRFDTVAERCRAGGIGLRLLKGTWLARWAYPDVASRNVGDLDILVRPADVAAIDRVLRDMGYRCAVPEPLLHGGYGRRLLSARRDIEYRTAAGDHLIEVHWSWTPNPHLLPFDAERVWHGSDDDFREDLFLYLCVHGGHHAWCLLKWVLDIHRIAEDAATPPLDWRRVRERAVGLGATHWVSLAFAVSRRLFGTAPPIDLPAPNAALLADCLAAIADPRADHIEPGAWAAARRQWRGSDGLGQALRLAAHTLSTPSEGDLRAAHRLGLPPAAALAVKPFAWARRRMFGGDAADGTRRAARKS